MSRAYTVEEIDDLREACESKWLYGKFSMWGTGGTYVSRNYKEDEKVKCVEELVRTYMIAGMTGPELRESGK